MSANAIPPWANPFVPREPVMNDMAAHVRWCREHGHPSSMYVYGLEGLGVSCLVTQFWKENRALVDSPIIWLSGRHADGSPVPLGELAGRALRQVGVPDTDQGATAAEKIDSLHRVWREMTRLLVVDDLDSSAQILPFVPVDAPGMVIVATSSFRRRDLEQHEFAAFTPDLLSTEEARALFVARLGDTAASLDPALVDELADYCGRLPLLIKVLAAQIRDRPPMAHSLLRELQKSGLLLLKLGDEKRMRTFLDTTYENLGDVEKFAYRLLGFLPAAHFGVEAAAAVLDAEPDEVYLVLEKLTELNLLTSPDRHQARYAFHPVLRDDARARAESTDAPDIRKRAVTAWITWYLRETLPRARKVSNRWWVRPVTDLLSDLARDLPEFTRPEALDWLELEGDNVIAAVRAAHGAQLHDLVWPLCVAVWKYLHLHGLYDAWIDTHLLGLASARAVESRLGIMQMTSQLGAVHLELREFGRARECFAESLDIAREQQHVLGEQSALEWLGKIAAAEGDFGTALTAYRQSWEVTVAATEEQISPTDRARVFSILRLQQARAEFGAGDFQRARECAEQAVGDFDANPGETDNRAKARLALGRAHLALGQANDAIAVFDKALQLFTEEGVDKQQAITSQLLGDAYRAVHQPNTAVASYKNALDYYVRTGKAEATTVAATIAELET
ncbi:tetratricopeptide repeat protein [Nocardia sp. SSK8]|uniref:tetratricopeptide repeat protein n=1 Tax=Nocardia sp. SSK8 TaxID=3120154 RepID=UPI0030090EA4